MLVRRETNPDDLAGMIAAQGILTSRGGKTSHAAVVARGMGKTCVCGAEDLDVDLEARTVTSPDGTRGRRGRRDVDRRHQRRGVPRCGAGACPSRSCSTSRASWRRRTATTWSRRSHRLVAHADDARRLGVRTNADTAEDAERARRFGAEGIGLCRTEHMFLGDRRQLVEDLVLADRYLGAGGGAGSAAPAAARRLHRDPAGDGRAAGDRAAARPAAARVPARPHRAVRARSRWPRPPARRSDAKRQRCWTRSAGCTRATRCSGCAGCGSAWSSPACSRCRSARWPRRPAALREEGLTPARGDGAAGRCGAGARGRSARRPSRDPGRVAGPVEARWSAR